MPLADDNYARLRATGRLGPELEYRLRQQRERAAVRALLQGRPRRAPMWRPPDVRLRLQSPIRIVPRQGR